MIFPMKYVSKLMVPPLRTALQKAVPMRTPMMAVAVVEVGGDLFLPRPVGSAGKKQKRSEFHFEYPGALVSLIEL